MGIYAKFYHDHSPNMVMSRDPGYKFLFFPDSVSGFWGLSIWGKLAQEQKSYRQRRRLWVGAPPVLMG